MLFRIPAALLLLGTTLGLAVGASLAQGPPAAAAATLSFDHRQHVSEAWSSKAAAEDVRLQGRNGEYLRDCQGCHDYRSDDSTPKLDRPADRCVRCHDPDGYLEKAGQKILTGNAGVDPAEEATKLFKHANHLTYKQAGRDHEQGDPIACATCHYQDTGSAHTPAFAIKLPSENSENKSYCTTCHDNDKPLEQWTPEDRAARRVFNEGLTAEAKARARASGERREPVFSHAAHLTKAELDGARAEKCQECHTAPQDAKSGSIADTQLNVGACARCHNGASFELQAAAGKGEPLTSASKTAGVFSHRQHLSWTSSKPGIKPIGERGCLACHAFEPEDTGTDGVRSFTLKPSLSPSGERGAFHGCVECHIDVKIENHGNSGECAGCHVIDPASSTEYGAMAKQRPSDAVARDDPADFTFALQSHKFVSHGLEQDAPDDCARCHKVRLESRPSRIDAKVFSHTTHLQSGFEQLSARDKNARCESCHQEVGKSAGMVDLKLAYDPAACAKCHGDSAPKTAFDKPGEKRSLRFDHSRHVGKQGGDGALISCVDCHVDGLATSPGRLSLAQGVADCTQCHAHRAEPLPRIDRFAKATVESCKTCHSPGIPAKAKTVPVARARLLLDGTKPQTHTGEARCNSCHQRHDRAFDINSSHKPDANPIVMTVANVEPVTPHKARKDQARLPGFEGDRPYFWNEVSCVDCHWHIPEGKGLPKPTVDNARDQTTLPRIRDLLRHPKWPHRYQEIVGNTLGGEDYPTGFPGLVKHDSK